VSGVALDLNKLAATAVEAYLSKDERPANGQVEAKGRRLGTGAAIAVGAGLAFAAQAAVRRVRRLDLEQVGTAVENKLKS
jgi:hypothetical protein